MELAVGTGVEAGAEDVAGWDGVSSTENCKRVERRGGAAE